MISDSHILSLTYRNVYVFIFPLHHHLHHFCSIFTHDIICRSCHTPSRPTVDNTTATPTRSRIYRSETGRRRSLERSHCFDYTDLSPTSDPTLLQLQLLQSTSSTHHPNHYPSQPDIQSNQTQQQQLASSHQRGFTPVPSSSGDEQATARDKGPQAAATGGRSKSSASGRSASPTIKVLQEYEQHLRNALAKGNDADTYSLNTFETILSQSMENVVAFMREVQSEIEAIRREESHYRSSDLDGMGIPGVATGARIKPHWARSYTLPSRGASLPPPGLLGSSTSDLYHTLRKSSAPVLDTLSVDYGHLLRPQSSFESTASDSKAYLTSSEVSTPLIFFLFSLSLSLSLFSFLYLSLLFIS